MDVRRLRTTKRRKEEKLAVKNQIHLERVIGLTILSNAGLACSPTTGTVAYPAGCTIVMYNARKNRQSHITNPSRKTFTTLDFSEDGHYLVTGECGHQPHVRVWDVHDKSMVVEFPGHKFGINCVSFAPNGKYVVSVGSQHDAVVYVWDWKNNIKVASNKISAKIRAVSFAENGNYFVTAGNRHVKFWYLEYSRRQYQEPTPLTGRSAILGEQRNNYFCDVACGRGEMGDSTYAITKSGLLCEFNNRRLLDKWVELRTTNANCLTVGEDFIFIGCADGIVRCFSPHTLQFITTLPRTHYLGVDVSKGLTISHMASHPSNARYPDATAITFDKSNFKVTVIYNDHSIYVWDVRDITKVGKSHSFLFHSACIWGLEIYPLTSEGQKSVLPPDSIITCSSDDTIRIWNLNNNMATNTLYRRNIYSEELLKIIHIDQDLEYIKDVDAMSKMDTDQKESTNTVYDQRNGVRCIRISPDGKHLASGDRAGNIRIHELQFMDEICKIEAHDAEVLCLEYSEQVQVPSSRKTKSLLASASRDRLIHVFNSSRDYSFLNTLDDHSSSITAIRFLGSHNASQQNKSTEAPQHVPANIQMVSCGADKSIIFRDITLDHKGQPEFQRVNHIVGKTTLYDMEIDRDDQYILTACQDRNIRVYNVDTGKHSKTFKGSQSEDGTLIKVVLDQSGMYAATSCTDKTLAIYEYESGDIAATMFGHSELVTGLKFTNDCKHLVSVSGDGCIFIWRLPQTMTSNMLARMKLKSSNAYNDMSLMQTTNLQPDTDELSNAGNIAVSDEGIINQHSSNSLDPNANQLDSNLVPPDYAFNVGGLPVWAKKQMVGTSLDSQPKEFLNPLGSPNQVNLDGQHKASNLKSSTPKGKWAQRLATGAVSDVESKSETGIASDKGNSLEAQQNVNGNKQIYSDDYLIDEDYNSMSEVEYGRRGLSPYQSGGRGVTFKQGQDPVTGQFRPRPTAPTNNINDDSSLGSLNNNPMVVESTLATDGDIDDFESDGLEAGFTSGTGHDDGGESTEPEHPDKTLFFGQQTDQTPASEYTINAMDIDELKRSRRKYKPCDSEINQDCSQEGKARNKSEPSQESDLEDDEEDVVSTPTAENAERNASSILSAVSTENVDLVGRRERFLKSNFESLSGADDLQSNNSNNQNTMSISNRYRESGSSAVQRNAATIARAQSFRDNEQNKRRELLQKRIEETRKKLQEIGYRSMIRGSQSISDLTNAIEPNSDSRLSEHSGAISAQGFATPASRPPSTEPANDSTLNDGINNSTSSSNGLRRVCSLSDLTKHSSGRRMLPAPPLTVSGKKPSVTRPHSKPNTNTSIRVNAAGLGKQEYRDVSTRQPQVHQQPTGNQIRKNSTSGASAIATQQTSLTQIAGTESVPSYMRSTSSSTKKSLSSVPICTSPSYQHPHVSGHLANRHLSSRTMIGQAQSTSDIRQAIKDEDSSSDDETSSLNPNRRRSSSHDRRNSATRINGQRNKLGNGNIARSERDLTKVTKVRVRPSSIAKEDLEDSKNMNIATSNVASKQRPKMKTTTMIVNDTSLPANYNAAEKQSRSATFPAQLDVVHEPLDWKLVEQTNMSLQQASDNLVQLYKRISLDHSLQENMRIQFLQKLVITADIAQQTLRPINPGSQSIVPNNMIKANTASPISSSGVTISGNNMSSIVNPQQQSYNRRQNIPKSNNPYFQQMIGTYIGHAEITREEKEELAQESRRHNKALPMSGYDSASLTESTTVPPPIPPPPIITPTNSSQGPSWC